MEQKKLNWYFPPTGGGPDDGIHNAMIEHFIGNYDYSLAREIIQNSIDAKVKDSKSPVKVVFKLEYYSKTDFPGHEELQSIINNCIVYWNGHIDTIEFLNAAKKCLEGDKIAVLKISDYNTVGLSGKDEDKNKEWYNLVKSRGSSSKVGGEGGSFGIGKGAPFAASDLRTVFYATKNLESKHIFQGISELVSHKVDDERKRGVGYFGYNQDSVRDLNKLLHKFWRQEPGTDIYVAGYKYRNDWKDSIVKSVLRNFWYAIYCDDLEVEVDNIHLNRQNLGQVLTDYFFSESFKDYIKPIGNPLQYYKTVKEGTLFERNLPTLGTVKFWFNEVEKPMNYVAMMRMSHMVIYSKRFNYPGNFSGVFLCDNSNGNTELRKMEPPPHDEWIPERNIKNGKTIIDEIIDFIRDCIRSMKQQNDSGTLDIPDLHKYLPDDSGDIDGDGRNGGNFIGLETETETSSKIQKKEQSEAHATISPESVTIINKQTTGEGGTGIKIPSGKRKKNGKSSGGGQGDKPAINVAEIAIRAFVTEFSNDTVEYKVIIRSPYSGKFNLKLFAVGEDLEEKIDLVKVYDAGNSHYLVSGNRIQHLALIANEVKELNIVIKSRFRYSLKIVLNEI